MLELSHLQQQADDVVSRARDHGLAMVVAVQSDERPDAYVRLQGPVGEVAHLLGDLITGFAASLPPELRPSLAPHFRALLDRIEAGHFSESVNDA